MSDTQDWNRTIIEEFRANGGKVGGQFQGAPLLLLHSTGAKSGRERVNPVMYQPHGDGFAVFASKAGGPTNPDWYHNLLAHPQATIEVATQTLSVRARVAVGDERERVWSRQKELYPGFADDDHPHAPPDPGGHPRTRRLNHRRKAAPARRAPRS